MKKWKHGIALLFILYGCYSGFLSISFLVNSVSIFPIIVDLMVNEVESIQRFYLGILILLNAMQIMAMLLSSVMCIVIGLSQRKWSYIMYSGVIGLVKYICTFLVLLPDLPNMEIISVLRNFRLSFIPLSIIVFAIYCKQRKSDSSAYLPISLKRLRKTLIGVITVLTAKIALTTRSNRFTWLSVKETEADGDHQDNTDK